MTFKNLVGIADNTAAGAMILMDLQQKRMETIVETHRKTKINRNAIAYRIQQASPFLEYSHQQLTAYGVPRRDGKQKKGKKGQKLPARGSKLGLRRRRELAMVKHLGVILEEMFLDRRNYSRLKPRRLVDEFPDGISWPPVGFEYRINR